MRRTLYRFLLVATGVAVVAGGVAAVDSNDSTPTPSTGRISMAANRSAIEEVKVERRAAELAARIAAEQAAANAAALRARQAAAARAKASRAAARPRPAAVAANVQGHAGSLPPIMLKIRYCESRNNYTAQNRSSTASGAWQFLDSSWANYAGYPRAYMAPPAVQDQKALNVYNAVGTRPWNASKRCWG